MSKENAYKSKIPIPINPLRPFSETTLKATHSKKNVNNPRLPLETLYQESLNLETDNLNCRKVRKGLRRTRSALTKIDSRHVTVRHNNEDLDWDFSVFKDNSRADDKNKGNIENGAHKRHIDTHRNESHRVSTPIQKTLLEPSRVRNIKKSLKRPHSRELIGISPAANGVKGDEKHRRKLFFTAASDRFHGSDSYTLGYNQDYGQDLYNYLLTRETIPQNSQLASSGRALLINWLVKVNGPQGNPAAVQTAAWYFDTVLSFGEIHVEKLQVIAAACYWIALKINGKFISAKKLVKIGGSAYSADLLMSTEKEIMRKLKFPSQPIVAQDFISYLSWVCDSSKFVEIELIATLHYTAGLVLYKVLNKIFPSTLAAAAVNNALNLLQKRELLVVLRNNAVYKTAEQKDCIFEKVCQLQMNALKTMSSPNFEYRAPLENIKDETLTAKILMYQKNRKTDKTI